jgi:PP-loop superfamily ATP-utilizing enzyme
MYSGGIDSTLVIISLLKNASEEERNNITILLSENSIGENPNFYKDHILGKT